MASVEKQDVTQPSKVKSAAGRPGAKARWSHGAKTAVGTAVARNSRVWFTIGEGILNEIYFPDCDKANTRKLRFIITGPHGFFSDEESDASHTVTPLAEDVPGYRVVSTCNQKRYIIEKEIISDVDRDAVLVRVHFRPQQQGSSGQHKREPETSDDRQDEQTADSLRLFLLADPHIADKGEDNSAWVGKYKDVQMLFAGRGEKSLACVCSVPFCDASCGYIGRDDGYKDLRKNGRLVKTYNRAKQGNVGLCAEIDWGKSHDGFVLALAFGGEPAEAALQARAGVLQSFEAARDRYIKQWQQEQATYCEVPDCSEQPLDMYRVSAQVLQIHASKRYRGAFVASLSLPWGFDRSDSDIGGYHVLWPRDMTETAMGKIACGDYESARAAVHYLAATQEHPGNWSQNMWLDGTVHWGAEQMDGIALPILLADRLRRDDEQRDFNSWPMVRGAAKFLVQNGPGTQQGRWEAVPGYSVYTMSTEIAALLAAAEFADEKGEKAVAQFLRETADGWNEAIDDYTYVSGTELAKKHDIAGYYFRTTPLSAHKIADVTGLCIKMPNHPKGEKTRLAVEILSPDALALVRFGLRAADDPRILATIKVLDAELRHEMKTGPGWKRSTYDGYGEHDDGAPFNGQGVGRCWPLLAGERGHYAIAAGDTDFAKKMIRTMAAQSSECGMIPEQVWDEKDIPEHRLYNGRPTGSGMPLVWAHAEYIKLLRSIESGKIWDMPPQTYERYVVRKTSSNLQIWTHKEPREWVTAGKNLRIDLQQATEIHWSLDGKQQNGIETGAAVLEIHSATLQLTESEWKELTFTFKRDDQELLFQCHRVPKKQESAAPRKTQSKTAGKA